VVSETSRLLLGAFAAFLLLAPSFGMAATHRLNATMDSRQHAQLAAEVEAIFKAGGPEAVMGHLRARGCLCYGPHLVAPKAPTSDRFIRCEKSGFTWFIPIKEWIVVHYGDSDYSVLVEAAYDVP
jgi:hypothetical protein